MSAEPESQSSVPNQAWSSREMIEYQRRKWAEEAHYEQLLAEYNRREAWPRWRKWLHRGRCYVSYRFYDLCDLKRKLLRKARLRRGL